MNTKAIVCEFKKDIPCFVCGMTDIVSLRSHIRNVHKEVTPKERRRLMKEGRRVAGLSGTNIKKGVCQDEIDKTTSLQVQDSSVNCSEARICDGGNVEYKDFVMAIQYPPVLPREINEVRNYKSEFLKVWKKKSLEPLSRNAKRLT